MGRARLALLGGNVALAALLVATWGTRLGWSRWHHDLAYALLALVALASWPLLRTRRVTTLLLASLALWSTLTGIFLVYVTPAFGHGRWMRWWHGATSVGFLLAFLAHWARNQPRLAQLARRLAGRRRALLAVAGAWALVAAVAAASWTTPLRDAFSDRWFRDLATLAFGLAAAAFVYGGLLLPAWRPGLEEGDARHRTRGAVDASLLASAWLVALTGFPLLYLARPLRALDAYWPVAAWHVVTSAMLLGLVALHVRYNARPLLAHARRA